MIKILCKAKIYRNEWVEGFYWNNGLGEHDIRIIEKEPFYRVEDAKINPDTLCMYTGIDGDNGEKIFDNTIIEFDDIGEDNYGYHEGFDYINRAVVRINDGFVTLEDFCVSDNSGVAEAVYNNNSDEIKCILQTCKVIGNIFDDSKLLTEVE